MLTKRQIRSRIICRLKTQKEADRDRKSKIIRNKLLRTQIFRKAKIVMFYIAFGDEVETQDMIKAAIKLGKIVTVPVCIHRKVALRPGILDESIKLQRGPYGVCEPSTKRFIPLKDLDIVIVPGLAFDKKGNRLGRGKGYYDRFLKMLPKKIPTIGLAFDFQILPKVPAKTHDINVNRIIFA
ncbi:MAG: 5-formyltetrahydrofolate cyclo-ligase [Candidatus Omnitrophota bacterium]